MIPNKNKYLIVAFFNAPTILARRWPSLQSNLAVLAPYNLMYYAQSITLEFLYGIGYEGNIVCEYTNSEPCGILAGGGENSRMGYNVVSPLTGAMARTVMRLTTDLPLATTKPVDGGITRFCKSCKICAESCAYDAILFDDDTSWDNGAIQGSPPGYNGWRYKAMECAHCGSACQAVCPFNAPRDSWIHQFVTVTQATTPIFNSFFANIEKTFGYGLKDPDEWWDMQLPAYGYDTTISAADGAY